MGENSGIKGSLLIHLSQHDIHEDAISDFNILESYLSPIRCQKQSLTCLYIATVACLEMTLRILGIQVPSWDKIYFLDVRDAMDQLCKIYPVADGRGPIPLGYMMSFATDYGFKVTSLCKKPRSIDELANFDDEALRCRIHGYSMLMESEVVKYVETFPIIAGVYPYTSMMACTQAFYGGPTEHEKRIPKSEREKNQHAVLIIGSMKVHMRTFLIVQNTWGEFHGFSGLTIVPFDCVDIFTVFVRPHINPKKFPYRKTENGTSQFVERHCRKRIRVFEEGGASRPSRGDDIMDLDP